MALNFQKLDLPMALNEAMFNDNGQCGYILKPDILRDRSLGFNPNEDKFSVEKNKSNRKKSFEILNLKIISAQNLPSPEDGTQMKTFVKINVHGIPSDNAEYKTAIKSMGLAPLWDEQFNFKIYCPELAFITMIVKDESGHIYGEYAVRYINMRQGKTKISNTCNIHNSSPFFLLYF